MMGFQAYKGNALGNCKCEVIDGTEYTLYVSNVLVYIVVGE